MDEGLRRLRHRLQPGTMPSTPVACMTEITWLRETALNLLMEIEVWRQKDHEAGDQTRHGITCRECEQPFTARQWDERHTSFIGEDVHARCCPLCNPLMGAKHDLLIIDDPSPRRRLTQEENEKIKAWYDCYIRPSRGEPMPEDLHVRINRDFTNVAPNGKDTIDRFLAIRHDAKRLGHTIADVCPPSREVSLALTKLEEAMMHAVAAVARNQDRLPPLAWNPGEHVTAAAAKEAAAGNEHQAPGTRPDGSPPETGPIGTP